MLGRLQRRLVLVAGSAACLGCVLALAHADAGVELPHAAAASVSQPVTNREALDALAHAQREGDQLVFHDAAGRKLELSVEPDLQARALRLFDDYQVPYGALVAIEPSTGRILAYVSHSSANPQARDLPLDPTPPAASVFKLITASALVEAGIGPDAHACYGGGSSRLEMIDITDNPRRDGRCASLADALGGSINAVFAKLADRNLNPSSLRRYANAFGFGQKLATGFALPVSPIDVPTERLEFARTAAGFWHTHMSPLHAALIAATFANDGVMPHPTLLSRAMSSDGRVLAVESPEPGRVVIPAATARTVAHMMLRTVQDGTSRHAFQDARGRPLLPGIAVAGKTGSLSANDPYRAYSWWIGFAPADKPRIALASLIVNTAVWRIKSSFIARELLREYLVAKPESHEALLARCSGAHCAATPGRASVKP
jgi:peptidoglycan glycosyltransferase